MTSSAKTCGWVCFKFMEMRGWLKIIKCFRKLPYVRVCYCTNPHDICSGGSLKHPRKIQTVHVIVSNFGQRLIIVATSPATEIVKRQDAKISAPDPSSKFLQWFRPIQVLQSSIWQNSETIQITPHSKHPRCNLCSVLQTDFYPCPSDILWFSVLGFHNPKSIPLEQLPLTFPHSVPGPFLRSAILLLT